MRLIFFLFISVLVHAIIANMQLPMHVVPKYKHHVLQLQLVSAKKYNQQTIGAGIVAEHLDSDHKAVKKSIQKSQVIAKPKLDVVAPSEEALDWPVLSENQHVAIAEMQSVDSANEQGETEAAIDTSKYYAATEVNRKALPQMNIDESMLSIKNYSGLPIKLRLYVNAYGRLVKIDRIGVLEQDIAYVAQLESLLYDVAFLPAKREGFDVDSYQDLQLSFNPLPMIGDPVDLN
jgi:hypothetical protein